MSDSGYSVIKRDVIKSFDCNKMRVHVNFLATHLQECVLDNTQSKYC